MMADADKNQAIPRFDHQFISEAQLQGISKKTFRIQLSLDHCIGGTGHTDRFASSNNLGGTQHENRSGLSTGQSAEGW